ncbi:MAG: ABC transporter ATP-binding protein [Dehalococcoidales bacterium]|nr:ABC transporter ATP-binding protein [Dehalococcoidales bacterium]
MVATSNQSDSDITGIELVNIHKRFGKLNVITDLSFSISKGEMCCLLGPSGCGKTTVLKIIAGILEADQGKLNLLGRDVTDIPAQERQLGMVFQNYALFPHMSVFENIAYGLRRRHLSEKDVNRKVDSSIELVKLQGTERRRPHELSGGQQQRVALARALVIEPQALLLDEPLSNLDARLRLEMRLEIHKIQEHLGITTVYVTHDQEEAMGIADRIVIMNNGAIEQIGSPKDIYEKPKTRFAADFIGDINFIEGEINNGSLTLFGQRFAAEGIEGREEGKILCGLRPERIELEEDVQKGVAGTIEEAFYFGSVMRYRVSVEWERNTVNLNVELPASHRLYRVGEKVGVKYRNTDIHFLSNIQPSLTGSDFTKSP